ncbi:hypothetical protein D0N36_10000 [Hymenobacter lapidiphilus]|uniref:hypothetical protein n=1 Tax=Hymenobacter sp. CCM 8763 TaxID=2303334 RepID=UPI000E350EE8|nr:hypothetical protein [Hymenobacter sp. CCM 8763]RFP65189.1 hypothetical protein D0N36_10000 [Hymenobacter sp. CCM 8763]
MFKLQPLSILTDDSGKRLASIEHDPARQLLAIRWFGNLTGGQVIYVARCTLQLTAATPYILLLNDKSQATGDWSEALEWLEYEWLPQVLKGGLHAIAYIFTPDMHNQLASYRFIERLKPYLRIEAFHDAPTALQWLEQAAAAPKIDIV